MVVGGRQRVGMHWGGFVMFKTTVQKLLNNEQFCPNFFNKIKAKNYREIGMNSW
jgi:hypothetical protein